MTTSALAKYYLNLVPPPLPPRGSKKSPMPFNNTFKKLAFKMLKIEHVVLKM